MNILIVDDEEMLLEMLTELLKMHYPECSILSFSDSSAAKQKIEEDGESISVVVTDCDMPKVDGFDIIEACIGKVSHVIMLSGIGENLQNAQQQFNARINLQTLQKPARIQVICDTIERALPINERR